MGVCCSLLRTRCCDWSGSFSKQSVWYKNDIATLNDGETITFVKNDLSQSSINLNVTTRPLSDAEIEMLFADLPVTADAYFDADNHNILGFEGKLMIQEW